jgi:MFS transporter, DHA3 family, macrolide efflux protein
MNLLRDRSFRLLWSGHVISSLGDAMTSLALLLTAQRLTGSTAAVAGTAIAIALPQLLFGLAAGVLVDRWDRRWVLIVTDLLRAGLVLGFLTVTTADRLWLLFLLAFAQSAVGAFFNPARSAFLPEILPADRLLGANSLIEMSRVIAGVAGVGAAGVIAGAGGDLRLVFLVDAATFLVSAALIARIGGIGARRGGGDSSARRELVDGLRVVFGSRSLRSVVLAAAVAMFGLGAVNVLLVPFVVDSLDASETWFGALEAAQVTSMVAAGAVLTALAASFRPRTLVSAGLLGLGLPVMAIAACREPWQLMALLFAAGWCVPPVQASVSTMLQTEVPAASRGRAAASLSTALSGAGIASMSLAGPAAAALGTRSVVFAAGAVVLCAGILSATALRSPQPQPVSTT